MCDLIGHNTQTGTVTHKIHCTLHCSRRAQKMTLFSKNLISPNVCSSSIISEIRSLVGASSSCASRARPGRNTGWIILQPCFGASSLDFNPATASNASPPHSFINAYQYHVLLINYIYDLICVTTLSDLSVVPNCERSATVWREQQRISVALKRCPFNKNTTPSPVARPRLHLSNLCSISLSTHCFSRSIYTRSYNQYCSGSAL